jgi:hypothetical protein
MIEHPHYCGPTMPVSRTKVETAALREGTCSPMRPSGQCVMVLCDATGAQNCAGRQAPETEPEGDGPCAHGALAARQFGEEIPDRDGRIQIFACERHGVPAVLHRIQHDHGGAVFHPGHAVD